MVNPEQIVSFQRAVAGAGPSLYLSAAFSQDLNENDQYFPRNRVFQYSLAKKRWSHFDVAQYIVGLCTFVTEGKSQESLVTLSNRGEIIFKDQTGECSEKITYFDPYTSKVKPFRGAEGVAEIGKSLFVCGSDGKVSRRNADGDWTLLTPQLLTDRAAKRRDSNAAINAAGGDWLAGLRSEMEGKGSIDSRKALNKVAGSSERELYVSGHNGGLLFFDGTTAEWVDDIPKVSLFGMYVEQGNVWVCGSDGTILHGNYHDGFDDYSLGTKYSFNRITRFKGKIYISANGGFGGPIGLFTYDGRKLEQVFTGLTPDIHDIHTVDAADGILWAVGYRDILCFDGKTWQRIDHPDNPPVR